VKETGGDRFHGQKKGGREPDHSPDIPAEKRAGTKILMGFFLLSVVILGLIVVFSSQLTGTAASVPAGSGRVTVWYFYGNGCEHCTTVTPYVASLQKKYPDVESITLKPVTTRQTAIS